MKKNTFQRIYELLNKKQRLICFVILFLSLISAILESIGVSAIIPLISLFLNKELIYNSTFVQSCSFLRNLSYEKLVILSCSLVVLFYFIKNLYFIFFSWIHNKFSAKINRDISITLFKSYMKCGYPFFLQHNLGYYIRGLDLDTSYFYDVIKLFFLLVTDILSVLLIFLLLLYTNWIMFLAVFISGIICVLLMHFIFQKQMLKAGNQVRTYAHKASQDQTQAIQGIKDVSILRRQNFFIKIFKEHKTYQQQATVKLNIGQIAPTKIIEIIFVTAVITTIGFSVLNLSNTEMFIAQLSAFALGSFRILPALGRISSSINGILARKESVYSLYDSVLASQNYIEKHPEADFESTSDKVQFIGFNNKLSLNNISFKYNNDSSNIIENLNLEIKKGSSIGFIGQSGAGKSTLIDVLLGLLKPSTGNICIDGININDIPNTWSKLIGYIPQSVYLTDNSIKNNIAFGIEDSKIDLKLINKVIKWAQLDDFVKTLPEGINTFVGDRGVRLSGGQRQRIAIARALYNRPEILILDEATSALDNDTEKAIMNTINSLQGNITLIIVAHRLTTIKNCNYIYEVKEKSLIKIEKESLFN